MHSEEAVEFGETDQFLRLNEQWEPLEDDKPQLRAVPVGVPGAYLPAQMNPRHVSPAPSPGKPKEKPRQSELDAGDKLGDAGLSGVNVTEDDLMKLVEELGLGEADANELVKGLTGDDTSKVATATQEQSKASEEPIKIEATAKTDATELSKEKADIDIKEEGKEEVKEDGKPATDATKDKDNA